MITAYCVGLRLHVAHCVGRRLQVAYCVGSVVRTRVVVVGERRDRRDGRQRAGPRGDRRRLLGEQGTERQHCWGGDAVGDRVGKWSRIQQHGTITVDGVAPGFDQSLHQHGQLLFNLGEHLGCIAVKPTVLRKQL
jgi:hypothetical protein